jgi:tetratricopeptide (TPR) repeat protein
LGRYKLALKDADTLIEMRPDNATGYVRRARALNAMGQRQVAIDELTERQTQNHNAFVGYWLADLLVEEGVYEKALAALQPTFDTGTADYFDMEMRAMILLELDRHEEAQAAIDDALAERENADYPYYYRALILVRDGDLDAADAAMETALSNGLPDHRVPRYLEALASKGAYVHAIQWRIKWRDRQSALRD